LTVQTPFVKTPRKPETFETSGTSEALEAEAPFVVTVTLNPAVDMFLSVDTLSPGILHRIATPVQYPGGKGINVSKALHALKVPVNTTGFIGGTRGLWIKNQLATSGIETSFVEILDETRLNTKIIDNHGQLTELNSEAPTITEQNWQAFSLHLQAISSNSKWIAFCGNLPANCRGDWYYHQIESAKARGLKTILDASGEGLRQGVLAKPNIIKPNLHELRELSGKTLSTQQEVVAAAMELQASGIDLVIVTLGADGMIVTGNDGADVRTIIAKVPKVPVASSVGAGDTVVAATLFSIWSDFTFEQLVQFAAAAGTAAVTKSGSERPQLSDIQKLVPDIQLKKWGR
jgi:1-phosphofructokinase family hexose kinase